jgi:hypothetical protein
MNYKLPKEAGTVGNLLKRFEEAKKRKEHWVSLLQEAYDYAIPHRETFYKHHKGQKRNDHIFDSTAIEATKEFVSRIQSTVVPPWRDWTRLMPGAMLPEEIQEDVQVQEQLDDATKVFFTYLNHSNFALQSAEALMDYAVSTGCLLFDEGDDENPFSFKAIPLAEVYPEEGPTTMIETVWREHEPLVRNIEHMYDDPDMGEELKKKAKDSPSARCTVIEGTVHVPGLEEPYIAVAIELKTKRLLWAAQYKTTPWIVFRSPTVPGELLGRGPVLDVLPDIKTANKMVELILRRASYSVSGVYTAVADGVLNPYTMKLSPGTVIPVGSNDTRNPSIGLLPMGGEPDFSMIVLEELRRNIKRALFNNLRTAEGPVKTATEISIDNRELLEYMGASFGRLQTEFVERIVKRGVDILVRRGLIPPMKINGTEITLQHTSPLARAQDFEEIENIERFIGLIGQLGPEAIQQNIQVHELGRAIGKRLGVDTDLLVSEEEQEERREAQEEASAAMITAAGQGMVQ